MPWDTAACLNTPHWATAQLFCKVLIHFSFPFLYRNKFIYLLKQKGPTEVLSLMVRISHVAKCLEHFTCPNTSIATMVQSFHIQPLILPKGWVSTSFKTQIRNQRIRFPSQLIADSHLRYICYAGGPVQRTCTQGKIENSLCRESSLKPFAQNLSIQSTW